MTVLWQPSTVSECAAISGSANILQWLAEVCGDTVVYTKEVMVAACANGRIQTVQYLLRKGCSLNESHCFGEAAKGDHLDLIKWMATNEPFSDHMIL
jgi:hypothetical protein